MLLLLLLLLENVGRRYDRCCFIRIERNVLLRKVSDEYVKKIHLCFLMCQMFVVVRSH